MARSYCKYCTLPKIFVGQVPGLPRSLRAEPVAQLAAFRAVLRLTGVGLAEPQISSIALQALPVLPAPAGGIEFAPFGVCFARLAVLRARWAQNSYHFLTSREGSNSTPSTKPYRRPFEEGEGW